MSRIVNVKSDTESANSNHWHIAPSIVLQPILPAPPPSLSLYVVCPHMHQRMHKQHTTCTHTLTDRPVTCRARLRMVAKQSALSVMPTAPLASSRLYVWDSLRRWSYAGTGSFLSSIRCASYTMQSVAVRQDIIWPSWRTTMPHYAA